jgi:hypothetical protein
MHRRRTSDRYAFPQAMSHDRAGEFGNHDARAASLVVDVWLTLIVPIHVASAVVVVMMMAVIMLLVVMVMLAMINMT